MIHEKESPHENDSEKTWNPSRKPVAADRFTYNTSKHKTCFDYRRYAVEPRTKDLGKNTKVF